MLAEETLIEDADLDLDIRCMCFEGGIQCARPAEIRVRYTCREGDKTAFFCMSCMKIIRRWGAICYTCKGRAGRIAVL